MSSIDSVAPAATAPSASTGLRRKHGCSPLADLIRRDTVA
jgi:hypothetical protein